MESVNNCVKGVDRSLSVVQSTSGSGLRRACHEA